MSLVSCIYSLTNKINGKRYIGSTKDWKKRQLGHLSLLRRGMHHSPPLQNAWNKYGEVSFEFVMLLICKPDDLLFYEQRAIDGYGSAVNGYNIAETAGRPTLGKPRSEETKAKLRAAFKGKPQPDWLRAKWSAMRKGQRKGVPLSKPITEETKAKISAALKGRPLSEETKKKIGDAHRGMKRDPSVGEKIRARKFGVKRPQWVIDKVAAAHRGLKQSPETRAKRAESMRQAWAKRKAGGCL